MKNYIEIIEDVTQLVEENKKLKRAVEDSNGLLRSMNSIVERKGKDTHWEGFEKRLREQLLIQHKIMFPEQYNEDGSRKPIWTPPSV